MINGSSRGSRPCWRHQPQFRDDCSPAICPFSNKATGIPRSASVRAAETPIIPPPMIATSVSLGSCWSEGTGSTRGGNVGVPLKQDDTDFTLLCSFQYDSERYKGIIGSVCDVSQFRDDFCAIDRLITPIKASVPVTLIRVS